MIRTGRDMPRTGRTSFWQGKQGRRSIKDSKEDTSGTELGWFAVFTAEKTAERPLLLVSMVEDVKGRGGSGYVVGKAKTVLSIWFSQGQTAGP